MQLYFFLVSGEPDAKRMYDDPFRPDRLMIDLNDSIGRKDLDAINNFLLSDSQQGLFKLHQITCLNYIFQITWPLVNVALFFTTHGALVNCWLPREEKK